MEGIEFLSGKKIVVKSKFGWKHFFIANVVGLIMSLCAGQFTYSQVSYAQIEAFCTIAIVGVLETLMLSFLFGSYYSTPTKYVNEYKIAVLNESLIDKIKEDYEIIAQEGKLWTIRQKM